MTPSEAFRIIKQYERDHGRAFPVPFGIDIVGQAEVALRFYPEPLPEDFDFFEEIPDEADA